MWVVRNGQALCDFDVLVAAAEKAGLPEPRKFLESTEGAAEVEEELKMATQERVTGALHARLSLRAVHFAEPSSRARHSGDESQVANRTRLSCAGVPFFIISDGKNKVTISGEPHSLRVLHLPLEATTRNALVSPRFPAAYTCAWAGRKSKSAHDFLYVS